MVHIIVTIIKTINDNAIEREKKCAEEELKNMFQVNEKDKKWAMLKTVLELVSIMNLLFFKQTEQ